MNEASGTNTAADSSYDGATSGTYQAGVTHGASVSGAVSGNTAAQTPGTAGSPATSGTVAQTSSVASPSTFSAEAWFNTASSGTTGKIFGFESNQTGSSSASFDRNVYLRGDGKLTYGSQSGSTVTSAGTYNDNKWHHVVATQGPSGAKLYVDGALIGSTATAATGNYTGYWRLGGGTLSSSWPSKPSNTYFAGRIDEFAVYPTVLSATDVAAHYGAGVNDGQAPTAPGTVNASATGSTVNVTWTAASDNVQVAGYRIYRGVVNNFTPGDANQVGSTTGSATLSFSNTAVPRARTSTRSWPSTAPATSAPMPRRRR